MSSPVMISEVFAARIVLQPMSSGRWIATSKQLGYAATLGSRWRRNFEQHKHPNSWYIPHDQTSLSATLRTDLFLALDSLSVGPGMIFVFSKGVSFRRGCQHHMTTITKDDKQDMMTPAIRKGKLSPPNLARNASSSADLVQT